MKAALVASLFFFIAIIFTPSAYAVTPITPTLYCLGSCPNSEPISGSPDQMETKKLNPSDEKQTETNPGSKTAPNVKIGTPDVLVADPCLADSESSTQGSKDRKPTGGGALQKFFELLFQLLEMLMKQMGIEMPTNPNQKTFSPDNTTPEPTPCQAQKNLVPPVEGGPSEEPSPSVSVSVPSISVTLPSISVTVPSVTVPPVAGPNGDPKTATCGGSANTPSSPVAGYKISKCEDFTSGLGAFGGYNGGGESTVVGGGRKTSMCTASGGMLVLTQQSDGSTCGGSMGSFAQKYGYWEVKMRTYATGEGGSAPHPVLILWPDSGKWADGELDYFESDIGDDGMGVYLHCVGNPSKNCYHATAKTDITQWHVYGFEWTASGFKGFLDGKQIYETDGKGSNPSLSMHQTIQLDNLSGKTPARPSKMEIDWVHMYSK